MASLSARAARSLAFLLLVSEGVLNFKERGHGGLIDLLGVLSEADGSGNVLAFARAALLLVLNVARGLLTLELALGAVEQNEN